MSRMTSTYLAVVLSVVPAFAACAQEIVVQRISRQSERAPHPQAVACVESGFKLIGGGARVSTDGPGNLLTASFPEGSCWIARSKDHVSPSPGTITAFAIGLRDPQDQWEVMVRQATGPRDAHPHATVQLPSGFALTGGGGRTNATGAGSLLTASFPMNLTNWQVRSKDHQVADPTEAVAFIIGIRRRNGAAPQAEIFTHSSGTEAHPAAAVLVPKGFVRTGGGARVNFTGPGNLMTASFPIADGWEGRSKDHNFPSPADIAVFAIGIR